VADEALVAALLERLVKPLRADGTTAELVELSDGVATVRYHIGQNPDCATCFMPPEDFREFFLAALERSAPTVVDVRVLADGAEAQAQ
jgi:Fe-S cluster biogenesis protein NfuA